MAKRRVFYSFHFENDVMRVQQIRNIGVIEGNTPVSVNEWEEIKRKGDNAVEQWIDENMRYKDCVIVLVGQDTAYRKWVRREIEKGWDKGRGVMGIYIHNIRCPRTGTCTKGANPFDQITLKNGYKLSSAAKCYDPDFRDAYKDIANNIENWIEEAIRIRQAV
jgi:hypothetical protein